MKIAIIHDWIVNKRGAEHVLEAVSEIFPEADIFTLVYDPKNTFESFRDKKIQTSFIQKLPFAKRHFRMYLPLFPRAVEDFNLKGYDLIISINHCVAKGVFIPKRARHICYCLTPMRYAWVYQDEYFGRLKKMLRPMIDYLKEWDLCNASYVDLFITVSEHVKNRMKRCYGKNSAVIFPPVDVKYFLNETPALREDFYLVVSELVPYKRTDLAVKAFNELGLSLVVIGDGPCKKHLMRIAKENIKFLNWQPIESLKSYYERAKALVYPQKEEFGIVAVEAQATGCPVIAYKRGGALDSVIENKTGVFFEDKTAESLAEAVNIFGDMKFDHYEIINNARRFDRDIFKKAFEEAVHEAR